MCLSLSFRITHTLKIHTKTKKYAFEAKFCFQTAIPHGPYSLSIAHTRIESN